jgi:uncharacterized membrane protein (DUF2068 family)
MKARASLRAVAFFETVKAALMLLAGFGLLRYAHVHTPPLGETLLRHFHLHPAATHPGFFARLLLGVTDTHLHLLALGLLAYAALRFVKAWGLWRERRWAQWFALVGTATYLPVEIYEFIHTHHWVAVLVFAVNLLIVAVLISRLRRHATMRGTWCCTQVRRNNV